MRSFLIRWESILTKVSVAAVVVGLCFGVLGIRVQQQIMSQPDYPTSEFTQPIRTTKALPAHYHYATREQERDDQLLEVGS